MICENRSCGRCEYEDYDRCMQVMQADHLIANNVVVREHGKWQIRIGDYGDVYIMCSACGSEFYVGDSDDIFNKKPNFCLECGADIRGE